MSTDPHTEAVAARRAAVEAEARARAAAERQAESERQLAAETAADEAQAVKDAADPRVGKAITLPDGRAGTVSRRMKDSYLVALAAGGQCWVRVAAFDRLEQRAAAATGDDVAAIIRQHQIGAAAGDIRSRATLALIDLEAIRAGEEPAALTDGDRARILARLQATPREPVDPATSAAILRRLDPAAARKQAAESYEQGVASNVHHMIKSGRRATYSGT